METAVKRMYEGMFLVDSGLAAQDWQKILDEVQRILNRAGADVVSLKKWDERRLTYNIQAKGRGTYILAYFNADPEKIRSMERDCQLSELIMRVLILKTDRMSKEDMEKPTPLEVVPLEQRRPESETRREDYVEEEPDRPVRPKRDFSDDEAEADEDVSPEDL